MIKKIGSWLIFIILIFLLLVILGGFIWLLLQGKIIPKKMKLFVDTPTQISSLTISPSALPTPEKIANFVNPPSNEGIFIFALKQGITTHLYAYHPQYLPLLRLTSGEWDDITPSLSPDKKRLAFASDRDGVWDIYILTIETGNITRVTNTPAYDASPTWSPDGQWIAYETYLNDNLEIIVQSLTDLNNTILLTNDPGSDYEPVWSPAGRQIAFVSMRSGENEIWLADLDKVENRFKNISNNAASIDEHPAWSHNGTYLAWAGNKNGMRGIYIRNNSNQDDPGRFFASGDWPAWGPNDDKIAALLNSPNNHYFTAYRLEDTSLVFPPYLLGGNLQGLLWTDIHLPEVLPSVYTQAIQLTPTPLWTPALVSAPDLPTGRYLTVPLVDVSAPYPMLQDQVDESYQALRTELGKKIGWDFLANLENAYIPLTSPAMPEMEDRWLYTGRGFTFNDLPLSAGWLTVVKDDFNDQTYWRIFLRCIKQDGTQGRPLNQQPWDFQARFTGDTLGFEMGGMKISHPPQGYWFDFTDLAESFGWSRVPSLSNWRSYYPAIRFNEYANTAGLDWRSAILELYPPEMLITPTPFLSPTPTVTPSLTPSITPSITQPPKNTLTIWPTWTITSTSTPTPSMSPIPTETFTPTPILH